MRVTLAIAIDATDPDNHDETITDTRQLEEELLGAIKEHWPSARLANRDDDYVWIMLDDA